MIEHRQGDGVTDDVKIWLAVLVLGGLCVWWIYSLVQYFIEAGKEIRESDRRRDELIACMHMQQLIACGEATWEDYGKLLRRIDERMETA